MQFCYGQIELITSNFNTQNLQINQLKCFNGKTKQDVQVYICYLTMESQQKYIYPGLHSQGAQGTVYLMQCALMLIRAVSLQTVHFNVKTAIK